MEDEIVINSVNENYQLPPINLLNTIKNVSNRDNEIKAKSNIAELEKVLKTAKELNPNKIVTVIGCGGGTGSDREKRKETLIHLAEKKARDVIKYGKNITLEPMSPYERRIIHNALTNSKKVYTESEGEEPNRYLVILPVKKEK